MKILPAVILFLVSFFSIQSSFSQDSVVHNQPVAESLMRDTTIVLERSFKVKNVYARKDRYEAIRDSIRASLIWSAKMHDTVIVMDPAFIVSNVYAEMDSLTSAADGPPSKRELMVKAIRDSLSAIGNALMHTADMQDTSIALDPMMQDTTIGLDPTFILSNGYVMNDRLDATRDSISTSLARAASMQDTAIGLDPTFIVRNGYVLKDRLDAIKDSIARPTIMQDTTIVLDASFVVRDLYPLKDSLETIRDSVTARADSLYSDSVRIRWAGWKKYEVQPDHSFTLSSKNVLKGKTKTELQYNIADFYLYLNGEPVLPPTPGYNFFAAGCLGFKYDDTLLLNSGLGSKVGVGVGIKIFQGKFTSTLHANTHNEQVYKLSPEDSTYITSVITIPVTQSLLLKYYPDGSHNEIVTGEYQATYNKFYQKTEDGDDEVRRYTVRIVFRCRVSGGINSYK